MSVIMPKLRAELDRLNLRRVGLEAFVLGSDVQGRFMPSHLAILIGRALNPRATLYHEAIHAMRALNLFTAEEWRALEHAAIRKGPNGEPNWIEKHDIANRYPDLTPSEQIEEAIAEEFAERAASRKPPSGSLLVNAFNKIGRILKAIRNAVRGAGFETAESVFGKAFAGEIGARDAGNTGIAARIRESKDQRNPPLPRIQRAGTGQQRQAQALPAHIPNRGMWDELTRSGATVFERIKVVGKPPLVFPLLHPAEPQSKFTQYLAPKEAHHE